MEAPPLLIVPARASDRIARQGRDIMTASTERITTPFNEESTAAEVVPGIDIVVTPGTTAD